VFGSGRATHPPTSSDRGQDRNHCEAEYPHLYFRLRCDRNRRGYSLAGYRMRSRRSILTTQSPLCYGPKTVMPRRRPVGRRLK
jgi:hypothetical protein